MKKEEEPTSHFWTFRVKENWISTISDTLMNNLSMATMMTSLLRSSTLSEVT